MSNTGILYMKGMNMTDSEDDMDGEDIWDDTKLNDAYDKALKMANLEVAKRVAMATNSAGRKKEKNQESSDPQPNTTKSNTTQKNLQKKFSKNNKIQKRDQKKESKFTWKEGMPCRARYDVDGFDYEAIVLTIMDDENCVIRYLGYNNTEIVPLSSLQPTLGKEARKDQMMEAVTDREEELSARSSLADYSFVESTQPTRGVNGAQQPLPNRRTKKNKRPVDKCFQMPNIPMPDMSMLHDFGQMEMPTPPPPMLGMQEGNDQALSNMLVSWYMSGYYTGLYQGMKRSKARQRDC